MGFKRWVEGAIAGAVIVGASGSAEAKMQKQVPAEQANAKLEATPNTKWAMELVEQAATDLKEVQTDKNPEGALEKWYNAYAEELFNRYSGPFQPGEEPKYSLDDYAVLAQATNAMNRLVTRAESAQGLAPNRSIADGLDRMRASVADRRAQAKAQGANGPVARK